MPSKLLAALLFASSAVAVDNTPIDPTLFEPKAYLINEREFEAIMCFKPSNRGPYASRTGRDVFAPRIESFLIEWGPVNENFPFVIRQTKACGQMQLLDDGIQYRGRIFAFGRDSSKQQVRKSESSDLFFFRSSSTDVNVLRASAAFFDDFNSEAVEHDERRWNVAHTLCALTETANFQINVQKHMHTQIGALLENGCPFEILTARARGVFDFTNTADVFVDIDGGGFPGHRYSLEIGKERKDVAFDPELKSAIRLNLDFSQLRFERVFSNGAARVIPGTSVNLFRRGDETYSIVNIRKEFKIRMDKNKIHSFSIFGREIFKDIVLDPPLEFTVGHVSMSHTNIKSSEGGAHAVTMHLDNFGWTGPDLQVQTYNYRNQDDRAFKNSDGEFTFTIPGEEVPQQQGVSAARLHFSLAAPRFVGSAGGTAIITDAQGQSPIELAFAAPSRNVGAFDTNVYALDMTPAQFRQITEQSIVRLQGLSSGFIGNMHLEFDLPCDTEKDAPFTVPVANCVFPTGFTIDFNCDPDQLARPTLSIKRVNGSRNRGNNNGVKIDMVIDAETARELRHNGGSQGLVALEVLLDCQVVDTIPLGDGGAFAVNNFQLSIDIDKNDFPNRFVELWVRAVDKVGRSSTLGLFGKEENYFPLFVDTGVGDGVIADPPVCGIAFKGAECDEDCVDTEGLVNRGVCRGAAAPDPTLNFNSADNGLQFFGKIKKMRDLVKGVGLSNFNKVAAGYGEAGRSLKERLQNVGMPDLKEAIAKFKTCLEAKKENPGMKFSCLKQEGPSGDGVTPQAVDVRMALFSAGGPLAAGEEPMVMRKVLDKADAVQLIPIDKAAVEAEDKAPGVNDDGLPLASLLDALVYWVDRESRTGLTELKPTPMEAVAGGITADYIYNQITTEELVGLDLLVEPNYDVESVSFASPTLGITKTKKRVPDEKLGGYSQDYTLLGRQTADSDEECYGIALGKHQVTVTVNAGAAAGNKPLVQTFFLDVTEEGAATPCALGTYEDGDPSKAVADIDAGFTPSQGGGDGGEEASSAAIISAVVAVVASLALVLF